MSFSALLGRVSLFFVVATGLGCRTAPQMQPPVRFTFRSTVASASRWLATPVAVELATEHDARAVEAADGEYTGEIAVSGPNVRPGQLALLAAEHGATHFRIITAGDELRVDVLLYRVEPTRWNALPEPLRPAPVAGPTSL
jgi:hypothetical protein